jgi:multicomponent Na+:H+ antiporter subunit D
MDSMSPAAPPALPLAMTLGMMVWLTLPFLVGFSIYLIPRADRLLALGVTLVSMASAMVLFSQPDAVAWHLLDSFGVTLLADSLSAFFILTNALVTAAVILYCWHQGKTTFFYTQVIILHGSVNAAFICADLISLYVALEVIGIAAFLLIAYPRSDRSLWVALRYLFISNTAMLFYLMGAALVYQSHRSFAFAALAEAPVEAWALILLGLLTKGGIFISGLWLPPTHGEAESPVSALLSGVVVKAGVFPLVRLALTLEELDPIVRIFGASTALLGVAYAMVEKDTKRMLAFHTVSQMGFVLAAPEVGGFYALTHGLVKAALFLTAGVLPSRSFKALHDQPIHTPIWIALVIASFSISGFPLLSGFGAKVLTMKNLLPWQVIAMNLAALGTAVSFAKFIFLPQGIDRTQTVKPGFWPAVSLLLAGLVGANVVYYDAYSLVNVAKPLATIALGWVIYLGVIRRVALKLPQTLERFEHLIGVMSLMLMVLFGMVFA